MICRNGCRETGGDGMPEAKDRSADILFCFDFSRGPKSTGA